MSPRISIPLLFPIQGISREMPNGRQEPHTTPAAQNMRGLDPISGRVRGAKRAGTRLFTTGPIRTGFPVRDVGQVVVDRPRVTYAQLTEAGTPDVTPSALENELVIEPDANDAIVALEVDRDGNVYGVEAGLASTSNRIFVWNPEGEEVHTLVPPMPAGSDLVDGIGLQQDSDGKDNLYLCSSNISTFEGRVFRYVKEGEGDYRLAWIFPIPYAVYDFVLVDGLLFLATRHSEGDSEGRVGLLAGLEDPEPFLAWQRSAPAPVERLEVARDGGVYLCAPANANRGQLPSAPGWFTPQELWSPHLLSNADERLYYWQDALALFEFADDSEIDRWRERRWLHCLAEDADVPGDALEPDGTNSFANATDTWNRAAFRSPFPTPPGPTYDPMGGGVTPGVRFNGAVPYGDDPANPLGYGQSLQTQPTLGSSKTDTDGDGDPNADGDMILAGGPVPGMRSISWTAFLVFRMDQNARAESLVSINTTNGQGPRIGVIVNGDERSIYPTQTNDGAAGKITLYMSTASGAAGNDEIASIDFTPSGDYYNDKDLVVLAFHHGGRYPAINPDLNRSWLRCNGRTVDDFNLLNDQSSGPSSRALWGVPSLNAADLWQRPEFAGADLISFSGQLLMAFTVLGDTSVSTQPHRVPTSYPNSGGGNGGTPFPSGTQYQYSAPPATNETTTNAATETERIEGWIAHRLGAPDVLVNGLSESPSGGFYQNHPFGGSSHPPVGPTGLAQTTPSDFQLALLSQRGILAKFSGEQGDLQWALDGPGLGSGAARDEEGFVFSTGQKDDPENADDPILRRIRDFGGAYSLTAEGCWEKLEPDLQDVAAPSMRVGLEGDLYWPLEGRKSTRELTGANENVPTNGSDLELESGDGTTGGASGTGTPTAGYIRYEFWATPTAAYHVAVGSSRSETALNLMKALAGTGTPGVHYGVGTEPHPSMRATRVPGDTKSVLLEALEYGPEGDSLSVIVGTAGWFVTDTELEGGRDHQVRRVDAKTGNAAWTRIFTSKTRQPYDVAFPPEAPLHAEDDLEGVTEFVWIATGSPFSDTDAPLVEKLRQLAVTHEFEDDESSRRIVILGVGGGNIAELVDGTAPAIPTGGEGALDSASPYVQSAQLFGDRFYTDGVQYAVYKGRQGVVEQWKAEGEGEIPPRCRLLTAWNQRLVLARSPDKPFQLFMSERGNGYRWDGYRPNPSPLDPIVGAIRYEAPDIVTSLIPGADDVLYIGGEQSLHVLVGDPGLGAGLDLLSRQTGVAPGRAWAHDPELNVYFVGSKGGLWVIPPGAIPRELSDRRIRRTLEELDFESHEVHLVWNYRDRGLHLFVVPRGAPGEILEQWFWERHTDGWWPDRFATPDLQPTAARAVDGDRSDDRRVLIGCADGNVTAWGPAGADDRGVHMDAWVDLPILPEEDRQFRFTQPAVELASDQGSALLELWVSDVADAREWRRTGSWEVGPGRNHRAPLRGRGAYARVRLSQAAPGQRFAYEAGEVMLEPAGRRRPRGK